MLKRIAFGTAGLRSRMAAGNACMNDLIIIQTTQGLCKYMLDNIPNAKTRGFVLGYDGRYHSREFAEIAAAVCMDQGFKVYLYSKMVATPMVPYGVTLLKAAGGVMVTASHNPKDDNGYKVYWENGAQIIPPHDAGIAQSIQNNLKPWKAFTFDANNELLHDPFDNVTNTYFQEAEKQYCWEKKANQESDIKVTFTAMHGVGAAFVTRAFDAFGLPKYIPVKQQIDPDPEFSTVAFPNPEEGKGALALAMQTADEHGSNLILANDPDADRLAVAERNPDTNEWRILNGNQIAALFADWAWKNHVKNNPNADKKNAVMIASTVSSKFLQAMADKEGFEFRDTLTGFKWMGNVAYDMQQQGRDFLFAYEVEIGFLVGGLSLDKDGVRMAAIFTEMAIHVYNTTGKTLWDHLQTLYAKYNYFSMNTSYFFCHDNAILDTVFGRLRADDYAVTKTLPGIKVTGIRDITTGYDNSMPDQKTILPVVPSSHMITFHFDNGCVATLRNSGTEPKLKYYVEARSATSEADAAILVNATTDIIIEHFMQPSKTGLIPRKIES
jgi:phosphomannomutase